MTIFLLFTLVAIPACFLAAFIGYKLGFDRGQMKGRSDDYRKFGLILEDLKINPELIGLEGSSYDSDAWNFLADITDPEIDRQTKIAMIKDEGL